VTSQVMPPQQQAALVEAGLDLACEQLLDEISLKVLFESDDGLTRKTYSSRQKKSSLITELLFLLIISKPLLVWCFRC